MEHITHVDTRLETLRQQTRPQPTMQQQDNVIVPTSMKVHFTIVFSVSSLDSSITFNSWHSILEDMEEQIRSIQLQCQPWRVEEVLLESFATTDTTARIKLSGTYVIRSLPLSLPQVRDTIQITRRCTEGFSGTLLTKIRTIYPQFQYGETTTTTLIQLKRAVLRKPTVTLTPEEQLLILEKRKEQLDITEEEEQRILALRRRKQEFEKTVPPAPQPKVEPPPKPKKRTFTQFVKDVIGAIFGK